MTKCQACGVARDEFSGPLCNQCRKLLCEAVTEAAAELRNTPIEQRYVRRE